MQERQLTFWVVYNWDTKSVELNKDFPTPPKEGGSVSLHRVTTDISRLNPNDQEVQKIVGRSFEEWNTAAKRDSDRPLTHYLASNIMCQAAYLVPPHSYGPEIGAVGSHWGAGGLGTEHVDKHITRIKLPGEKTIKITVEYE
ncbi:MAG: hypothetical protein UY48_C0009G0026 [Candidatus Gottesmanbacteria bacterium GW2011_GWB1_49_7]|uniref:Uncharacterized protein n=1 Tax=Candidatus Gottesmanbacteria bacterium GW2011_GWB1_49_7 TaxID=1618448 RepID=A0A0G1W250_9BACT|nr:MAG: hypothetical protein UY48_C0009G0026 [Candidatus Gottesmanbacteria bacterium GW2011_GWB1_49_7]